MKKGLKPEEKYAQTYLNGLRLGVVEYEPIPNEPPDFLVGGRVAVEVRRLNENVVGTPTDGPRGLEEVDIPVWNIVKQAVGAYKTVVGTSALVTYRFKRPVNTKLLRKGIAVELAGFLKTRIEVAHKEICPNFWLSIRPTSVPLETQFRVLVTADEDSGGDLIPLVSKNLALAVTEKEKKTATNWSRYAEWWLVLVDVIGLGTDEMDRNEVRRQFVTPNPFERIIILGENPTDGFEVYRKPRLRHEEIAVAAYFLAERRRFKPGSEIDDWLAAEASLRDRLV